MQCHLPVVFFGNTKAQGNAVILEFSDTGPGMQEPDRVFDPFYTTKPVGQGTGLGLSACYGIIAEHSGKIFCENRASGGATFRIELPLRTTAQYFFSTHTTALAVK